jgi:nucleotide-binding universal stress UspA family protein
MYSEILQRWCEPRVILVATNLDDQAALMCHAVAETRRSGARLLLVHVISSAAAQETGPSSPPDIHLLPSTQRATDALEDLARRLRWQGVVCEPLVLRGRADEQIDAVVRSRNVDRVIVAARDYRGRESSHRRSVADCLMALLPVPVCVVTSHVCPGDLHEPAGGRVLLPLSLHAVRREYVDFACGVARARGARLTLLHVVDPSRGTERERAMAKDTARLRLAALAATHEDLVLRPDIEVREGDPATQIVEEALCPFRDVIILGSSSLTAKQQQSGILARVLSEARCPMMTLKPPATVPRLELAPVWAELKTGSLN